MSEHITPVPAPTTGEPPTWLRQFLAPDEPLLWWQGPTESRWQEWARTHEPIVFLIPCGCMMAFPIAGALLNSPVTFILGALAGVGLVAAAGTIIQKAKNRKWQVVTSRRLFVVVGAEKTEEFDLDQLRQILASLGSAIPLPTDDWVIDRSKFVPAKAITNGTPEGITDLAAVVAMARLVQQTQGPRRGD